MAYLDIDNLQAVFLDDDALSARHLHRQPCGPLNITSGRIVACDPLVQPEREPFARSVNGRGAFPVEVLHDKGRHALAVLWLRERGGLQVADLRWEPALLEGQSQDGLGDEEFFGYPVDAGVGCFMDADAAKAMAEREAREAEKSVHFNYYDDVLAEELGSADIADHYPQGAGTANNILIFSSGWGDGSYPSFWALDAAGEPVALVTDFMTMTGGDARDENDKRSDAYKAGLSPEKMAALDALGAAAIAGDLTAIRSLLDAGLAGANEIIPSLGETAITSAIRMNQLDALRMLLGSMASLPMPPLFYTGDDEETYLVYARRLKKPRVPGLIELLQASEETAAAVPVPTAGKSLWKRLLS
ncbi:DUF4241 domain-containing protein [Variovorax sp. PAMC26660]|uniref:DUF4241 domain-containing protein n=1 Tax=Variovorax sp. PAMC26660 TaxID=2762322 RepID=UPI00164ECCE9|nr:DUF4241 domain-containing protein [Variovorax sp. PAMC26660]QNK66438.1 DUF4241 domain-containing protein [Variovorax sp. PAMC26660]